MVKVRKDGPTVAVDVDCPVDAPWQVVWEVLTDYAHMPQFISNIEYSVVEETDWRHVCTCVRRERLHGVR